MRPMPLPGWLCLRLWGLRLCLRPGKNCWNWISGFLFTNGLEKIPFAEFTAENAEAAERTTLGFNSAFSAPSAVIPELFALTQILQPQQCKVLSGHTSPLTVPA